MKINIEYGIEISEETFFAIKEEFGVDADEELIGLLKYAIKAQNTVGCEITNLKVTIEHDKTLPSKLN